MNVLLYIPFISQQRRGCLTWPLQGGKKSVTLKHLPCYRSRVLSLILSFDQLIGVRVCACIDDAPWTCWRPHAKSTPLLGPVSFHSIPPSIPCGRSHPYFLWPMARIRRGDLRRMMHSVAPESLALSERDPACVFRFMSSPHPAPSCRKSLYLYSASWSPISSWTGGSNSSTLSVFVVESLEVLKGSVERHAVPVKKCPDFYFHMSWKRHLAQRLCWRRQEANTVE